MSWLFGFVVGFLFGMAIGMWSSVKYQEEKKREEIKAGQFQFEGQGYEVWACTNGRMEKT